MQEALRWLARLFGASLICYGVFLAYQTWRWTEMGLHQRVYDGESQTEIELNAFSYAIFHAPSMRNAFLLSLAGMVIILQTLFCSRQSGRN